MYVDIIIPNNLDSVKVYYLTKYINNAIIDFRTFKINFKKGGEHEKFFVLVLC